MDIRDADKSVFQWTINCLQEKLQEGARSNSQPIQSNMAGNSHLERSGSNVNSKPKTNPVILPTASLGGQKQQEQLQEPPIIQAESDKEQDESEIIERHDGDEDTDKDKRKWRTT